MKLMLINLFQRECLINQTTIINNSECGSDINRSMFRAVQIATGLYLLPFICVFGIIGNIINVILFSKSNKCSINFYLIVLAISDIVKLINDSIYFIVILISEFDFILSENLFSMLYLYSHYLFVVTAINTSWLTCAISYDRYQTVVKSRSRRKNYKYYLYSIRISMLIIGASLLVATPSVIIQKNKEAASLNFYQLREKYNYFRSFFRVFIPMILIMFYNFLIAKKSIQMVKSKM